MKYEPVTVSSVNSSPEPELRRLVTSLDALHLDDTLPAVRAYVARGDALLRARITDRQEYGDRRAKLVDKLADGGLDLAGAAHELVQLEGLASGEGALPKLVRDAAKRAFKTAWKIVQQSGDDLLDDVGPLIADTLNESIDLAATLPDGLRSLEDAVAAGPGIADKWVRLRQLRATWDRAHGLCDSLRATGGLPIADDTGWPPSFIPVEYRFEHPDATRGVTLVRELAIAGWDAAGAEPGIYSARAVALREQRVAA